MNLPHIGTRYERIDLIDGETYIAATNIHFELRVNGELFFKPGVLTPDEITDYSLTWDTDHYDLEYTYVLPYGAQIHDRIFGDVDASLFEETVDWSVDVPPDAFKWLLITPSTIPRRDDTRIDFTITAYAISLVTGQPIPAPVAPELSSTGINIEQRVQRSPGRWDWLAWADPVEVEDADVVTFAVSGQDIRSMMVQAEAAVPAESVS